MRENKYRIWDESAKAFSYLDLNAPADPHEFYVAMQLKSDWLQYTGLKDKNGVEIYEGDICVSAWVPGKPCEVAYGSFAVEESHHVGFYWKDSEQCPFGGKDADGRDSSEFVIIIGNIHENPELLEIGK